MSGGETIDVFVGAREHTRSMSSDVLVQEFLVAANSDFVYLAELPAYATRLGAGDGGAARQWTLAALKVLLDEGLWQAGDLAEGRFRAWPCSSRDALARIDHEWSSSYPFDESRS